MTTGFAHPKCFARDLHNCSRRISKEHFISKGLMRLIGAAKSSTLRGPAWMGSSQEMKVSTASLASKVLCERHNNQLSPLDEEMIAFVGHLTGSPRDSGVLNVNGFALERWLLKAQQGFLASGSAHKQLKGWSASETTLDILFGDKKLADGCGFYFLSGSHQDEKNAMALLPIRGPERLSMAGIALLISGLPFLFLPIPPWPALVRNVSPLRLRYRPEAINIRHGTHEREVRTGWRTGEIVEIDVSGPFP